MAAAHAALKEGSSDSTNIPFDLFADFVADLAISQHAQKKGASARSAAHGGARLDAHDRTGVHRPDRIGSRTFSFSLIPSRSPDGLFQIKGDSPVHRALELLHQAVTRGAASGIAPRIPERNQPHLVLADSIRRFMDTYVKE